MKKYLLRNGAVVVVDNRQWDTAGVRCVKAGGAWIVGQREYLLYKNDKAADNPLEWEGGAWGKGYDFIGEYTGPVKSALLRPFAWVKK